MAIKNTSAIGTTPVINQGGQPPHILAFFCLLLVGGLLGLSLVIAKVAVAAGAAPMSFLFLSIASAGLILLLAESKKGVQAFRNPRVIEYGLFAGALFAGPNVIAFLAVHHVGAGFLSLTFAFPILITYALALALNMDRFRLFKALAVLLGISGGCILALSKASAGDTPIIWIILAMMSPIIIAIGNIYRTIRWPVGVSSISLASVMLLGGAIIILPMCLIAEPGGIAGIIGDPDTLFLQLVQVGVFSVMYVFYFLLQRLAGPVYLSQIGFVAAIVGTSIAVSLLAEPAPKNLFLAAVLIASGTLLFHWAGRKPSLPAPESDPR